MIRATAITQSSATPRDSNAVAAVPDPELDSTSCVRLPGIPVDMDGQLDFVKARCHDGLTPIWSRKNLVNDTAITTLVPSFSSKIPVCFRLGVAMGASPSMVTVSLIDEGRRTLSTNRGRGVFLVPRRGNLCILAESTFQVTFESPENNLTVGLVLFSSGGPGDIELVRALPPDGDFPSK